jgi:hypothetical protein
MPRTFTPRRMNGKTVLEKLPPPTLPDRAMLPVLLTVRNR